MVRELSQEKRDKFLSAALRLFVANGVQNTSTAEIAREAGTAAGTLFLYFPTKQALVDALALKASQEQGDRINALLEPSMNPREAFYTIWRSSIDWFIEHIDSYRYIQQVRDTGMLSPSVAQESLKHLDFYYSVMQKGLAEGAIRPYPLELTGGMLYQAIVAVMNLILAQPDPQRQSEYIEVGFEFFWNGIKKTK